MLDNWQRIEKVIKWTGLSTNAFARNIGLNRSENLYQIKKGNNRISRELAQLIVDKYPAINKLWLLTGEGGGMFADDGINKQVSVPYYDVDVAVAGGVLEPLEPSAYISLPGLVECDFAARMQSRAMMPVIHEGAIVVMKGLDVGYGMPERTCLVISKMFSGVRNVVCDAGDDFVRLVPANLNEFGVVTLRLSQIIQLYEVCAVVAYI